MEAAGLVVALVEEVIAIVTVRAVDQLYRHPAIQRQAQTIALARHKLGIVFEALRFQRPFGQGVLLVVGIDRSAGGHATRLCARRHRQQTRHDRKREHEGTHHRLGASMVSRLMDRKVASAISSISRSTRCRAPPMSVSSPGSLARRPGAGSNRATMSMSVVRRRLPVKR